MKIKTKYKFEYIWLNNKKNKYKYEYIRFKKKKNKYKYESIWFKNKKKTNTNLNIFGSKIKPNTKTNI